MLVKVRGMIGFSPLEPTHCDDQGAKLKEMDHEVSVYGIRSRYGLCDGWPKLGGRGGCQKMD